eukprot:2745861-Amphidinium_carterae.1
MAWKNKGKVTSMLHSLQALKLFGAPSGNWRRRGGPAPSHQPVKEGSKKWSAQTRTGWHCPMCKYYNFRFQETSFMCKVGQEKPGQTKPEQPGKKPLPSNLTKPWEQLENQLANETDPEVKAQLQKAAELKKTGTLRQPKNSPWPIRGRSLLLRSRGSLLLWTCGCLSQDARAAERFSYRLCGPPSPTGGETSATEERPCLIIRGFHGRIDEVRAGQGQGGRHSSDAPAGRLCCRSRSLSGDCWAPRRGEPGLGNGYRGGPRAPCKSAQERYGGLCDSAPALPMPAQELPAARGSPRINQNSPHHPPERRR